MNIRRSLAAAAAILAALPCAAGTLQGTFDRTFDVRPGTLFSLKNENGRIVIRTWTEARVQLHATERVESRDPALARRVLDAIRIVPTATAGELRIEAQVPRRNDGLLDWIAGTNVSTSIDWDIALPQSMDVHIVNTNGRIEVAGVSGSIRISDTNGRIDCQACAGDIDAETTNGSIRAELTRVNQGRNIRLESTNGKLTVVLPRSFGAQIDAETTNGSIDTDLPVVATERRGNALRGTIQSGGPELRLRTTNGSIAIEAH